MLSLQDAGEMCIVRSSFCLSVREEEKIFLHASFCWKSNSIQREKWDNTAGKLDNQGRFDTAELNLQDARKS